MDNLGKKCQPILLFFLIVVLWFMIRPSRGQEDPFDPTVTEFVPVGDLRHDLRGFPLKQYSIDRQYMSPNRQILLTQNDGEMWRSDVPPGEQGLRGCEKVSCPAFGDAYDSRDTCWKCQEPTPVAESDMASSGCNYTSGLNNFLSGCQPFAVYGADTNEVPVGWPNKPFPPRCGK